MAKKAKQSIPIFCGVSGLLAIKRIEFSSRPGWTSPVSERLGVLLHALVLGELHQLAGGAAHVDRRGSSGRQVAQRVPDEGHEVVAPRARPQLHRQAQAAHDGDGGSAAHLQGERSQGHRTTSAALTNHPFQAAFTCELFQSALTSAHWRLFKPKCCLQTHLTFKMLNISRRSNGIHVQKYYSLHSEKLLEERDISIYEFEWSDGVIRSNHSPEINP